jgi:hypothetical protein
MILPAGVIQSLNDNGKNPVGGTITADQDIWSIDYSQLLDQPIYIAADTLNELRFLATSTTLTILKPDGSFLWAGFCELVADPVSWTGVTEIIPPALMTATGSTVVTLAWDGSGSNIVLDDGSTIPESSLTPPKSYYYSTLPATISNSTTQTSLVIGIIESLPTDQAPGSPIAIKGNGTVKWNALSDYITWTFGLGANTLSTFTIVGTDLKVASALSTYMWELDAQINFLSVNVTNANVQIVGTLKVYDDYVVLEIPINTTIVMDTTVNNQFNLQVQWSAASVNNVFVADWIKIFAMSVTYGATTGPSSNYDGGQANTIYGSALLINGGNA